MSCDSLLPRNDDSRRPVPDSLPTPKFKPGVVRVRGNLAIVAPGIRTGQGPTRCRGGICTLDIEGHGIQFRSCTLVHGTLYNECCTVYSVQCTNTVALTSSHSCTQSQTLVRRLTFIHRLTYIHTYTRTYSYIIAHTRTHSHMSFLTYICTHTLAHTNTSSLTIGE